MIDIDPEDYPQYNIAYNTKCKIGAASIKHNGKQFKKIKSFSSKYQPDD